MNLKNKTTMKKVMIFAAVTLLLSSCGLYNKYERPDNVETSGLIRDAVNDLDTLAVAPQDTASFGNLPWLRFSPILSYRHLSNKVWSATPIC